MYVCMCGNSTLYRGPIPQSGGANKVLFMPEPINTLVLRAPPLLACTNIL